MIPGGFSGFFTVPGQIFMNTGGSLWLFIVPRTFFHDSRLAFVVIHGSIVLHGKLKFLYITIFSPLIILVILVTNIRSVWFVMVLGWIISELSAGGVK